MMSLDEDALTCDFAETYHVLDMQALSPDKAAVLAVGLREDSRIKRKLSGVEVSYDTVLTAGILDDLNLLLWSKTKDGQKNRNRPKLIARELTGHKNETKKTGFDTPEAFMEAWRR